MLQVPSDWLKKNEAEVAASTSLFQFLIRADRGVLGVPHPTTPHAAGLVTYFDNRYGRLVPPEGSVKRIVPVGSPAPFAEGSVDCSKVD